MNLIDIFHVMKAYGSFQAVDDVSFSVKKGEVFSLLGPNGAGKTTLIEILEGVRKKDSGDVKVLGCDPWQNGDSLHRRVGIIPQHFTFVDKSTPREAMKYYAKIFGVRVDTDRILKEVLLEDSANVLFENLSGGQKQKMGLALSLVNSPELLFLDEPTTGLDPTARRAVWDVIRKFKTGGKTIILTTHYLEEAEHLSDRVAIMDHGRIIAIGTSDEIIASFGSGERLDVRGGEDLAKYLKNKTKLNVTYNVTGFISISLHQKHDAYIALAAMEESGLPWSDFQTRRDSLEDVFVKLVGGFLEEHGEVKKVKEEEEMINLSRIVADFFFFGRVYLRDRVGLFFAIIFPVIFIIIFGAIFLGGSSGPAKLYLQNHDHGPISGWFITALKSISSNNLQLVPVSNSENISSYLAAHSYSDGLFIPPNFSADFMTGKSTKVTVYGNPATLSSTVVSGIVNAVVNEFNLRRAGGSPVLGMYETTVKGQSFTYIDFLIPGLIGFSILTSPMFSLVNISSLYKKLKLFKQLSLTPLSKGEWLVPKVLWYIFLGVISFVLMVGVGAFGFGVHVFLSVWIIPFLILGPMFFASLGMVIGIVAKSVETSSIIAQVITFPMMFLSGTFFPIIYMPTYIQYIAHALPLFYVIEGLNAVMIYNNYGQVAVDIVIVTVLALGMLVAAVKLFKWRED